MVKNNTQQAHILDKTVIIGKSVQFIFTAECNYCNSLTSNKSMSVRIYYFYLLKSNRLNYCSTLWKLNT